MSAVLIDLEVLVEESGARGSRTLTTLRSGDFKSPASTIPPSPQASLLHDSTMLRPVRQSLFSVSFFAVNPLRLLIYSS